MTNEPHDQELRKQWFRAKLAAEKSKNDILRQVKGGKGDSVLVDTRDAASYQRAHIPGAISIPFTEVEAQAERLDREREYVTYCWNRT